MNFNFKDAAPQFPPVPEDRYEVEIAQVTETSTKTGDPMLNIKVIIKGSMLNGDNYNGRVLWSNMSLGDKAIGFFKRFLEATGSPLANDEDVTLDQLRNDLIGRRVSCSATPGTTPNGKPKNDLRFWQTVDGFNRMIIIN
jgi:hypothetical protein